MTTFPTPAVVTDHGLAWLTLCARANCLSGLGLSVSQLRSCGCGRRAIASQAALQLLPVASRPVACDGGKLLLRRLKLARRSLAAVGTWRTSAETFRSPCSTAPGIPCRHGSVAIKKLRDGGHEASAADARIVRLLIDLRKLFIELP